MILDDIRQTDTFIVAYPKSGGSWFCTLIANILKKEDEEYMHLWSASKYIPDINAEYFGNKQLSTYKNMLDPRYFFIHAPYNELFPKVIYILRDVRDVLVSYYNWKLMKDNKFNISINDFIMGNKFWPCDWDLHVSEWIINTHKTPIIIIKYEDLLHNTENEIIRALNFCDIKYSDDKLMRSINESSFKKMRTAEKKMTLTQYPKSDPEKFFVRRGISGGWKDELDNSAIDYINSKYGLLLQKLKYKIA